MAFLLITSLNCLIFLLVLLFFVVRVCVVVSPRYSSYVCPLRLLLNMLIIVPALLLLLLSLMLVVVRVIDINDV